MKNYKLYEAQGNAMNYVILTDGEGCAKYIDHDVSDDEITELANLFAEQGGKLKSRVKGDWMSETIAFDGLFDKRELESACVTAEGESANLGYLVACHLMNGNIIPAFTDAFSSAVTIADMFSAGEYTVKVEITKIPTGATTKYVF